MEKQPYNPFGKTEELSSTKPHAEAAPKTIAELRAHVAKLEQERSRILAELTKAEEALETAIKAEAPESFPDFAEPIVLPKDWEIIKNVDFTELAQNRPPNFLKTIKRVNDLYQNQLGVSNMLEDFQALAANDLEQESNSGMSIGEIKKLHYTTWSKDDFDALLVNYTGKSTIEEASSFDVLKNKFKSIVEDLIDEEHVQAGYNQFFNGDALANDMANALKELIKAQPKEQKSNADIQDAIEVNQKTGTVMLMEMPIFEFDRNEAKNFSDKNLTEAFNAFLTRYLPFAKREAA